MLIVQHACCTACILIGAARSFALLTFVVAMHNMPQGVIKLQDTKSRQERYGVMPKGMAVHFGLHCMRSGSKLAAQLDTSVCDAGPRNSIVSVLPHQDAVVAWQVVPYSSGYQPLPQIELTSRQHSVLLNASHGRTVHVLPAPLPTEASLQGLSSDMAYTVDTNSMSRLATQQHPILV